MICSNTKKITEEKAERVKLNWNIPDFVTTEKKIQKSETLYKWLPGIKITVQQSKLFLGKRNLGMLKLFGYLYQVERFYSLTYIAKRESSFIVFRNAIILKER